VTRRQRSLPVAAWALSRLVLVLLAAGVLPYGEAHRVSATSDIRVYERFAAVLAQGHFPLADPTWQYPPGAVVLLLPRLLPVPYSPAFGALVLGCDLAVLLVLQRLTRRHGAATGPWVWVVGVALLGPIVLGRFDVVPAALAVAALASPRASLYGALAGAGALVKLWPVTALTGLPPGPPLRRGVGAALVVAGGGSLVLGALLPGAASFLRYQGGRGLQIEAVAATPYLLARHVGATVPTGPRYGAREVLAGGTGAVALACSLLTVAALAGALLWRRRASWSGATAYDATLALTLLLVVTSRVLSPQYLLWLLALAAVCATHPDSSQRPVARLLVAAAALTQLEFPLLFAGVVHGALGPDLVLATRNAVLVVAAVLSSRRLWLATTGPASVHPAPPAVQQVP